MKKQYVIVEHRNSRAYEALRAENERLRKQVADYKLSFHRLESRLGEEVYLNAELIDLLRDHDIPFRQVLDHRVRAEMQKSSNSHL